MGGPDLDDVLGGVDYLKSLGNIDMDKLGIWGVSYGGFMTDMAMFLSPGTFKAGSAWAAVTATSGSASSCCGSTDHGRVSSSTPSPR